MNVDFGCVVLTMGKRPEELRSAVESLISQKDVTLEIIIVGNGWDPQEEFPQMRTLFLKENLGIPAGRNAGAKEVSGTYLFFLDDDVLLSDQRTLVKMKELMSSQSEIALIQPRVIALKEGEKTPARWVPRLRIGDEKESSVATSLWEGATAIDHRLFDEIGGWPANFFYAHEGIELVWRVLDHGKLPWYAADIEVKHPVINPARHDYYYFLNARNRVWLAKRNLRFPFSFLYTLTWILISLIRIRDMKGRKAWFMGLFQGLFTESQSSGDRMKKLHWKTHWLLTRYGRPPII
jgi:GT2 family glycosyltransferase